MRPRYVIIAFICKFYASYRIRNLAVAAGYLGKVGRHEPLGADMLGLYNPALIYPAFRNSEVACAYSVFTLAPHPLGEYSFFTFSRIHAGHTGPCVNNLAPGEYLSVTPDECHYRRISYGHAAVSKHACQRLLFPIAQLGECGLGDLVSRGLYLGHAARVLKVDISSS